MFQFLSINIGFLNFGWIDIVDIVLVSIILFQLYKLVRGSVAVNIFIGLLAVYLFYLVVRAAEMELLTAIFGQFIGVGVIAAVILFQQEFRKFLLLVGRTTAVNNERILNLIQWNKTLEKKENVNINVIVKAAENLSETKTGALIIMSKNDELQSYIETGDLIDGLISKRLLLSIFFKNSPMHDGAVIISKGRIKAARCIIPVSEKEDIPAHLGLRHRASIGVTEISDCIVLVVSEETGAISVVNNGQIQHNLSPTEVRTFLHDYLIEKKGK